MNYETETSASTRRKVTWEDCSRENSEVKKVQWLVVSTDYQ